MPSESPTLTSPRDTPTFCQSSQACLVNLSCMSTAAAAAAAAATAPPSGQERAQAVMAVIGDELSVSQVAEKAGAKTTCAERLRACSAC